LIFSRCLNITKPSAAISAISEIYHLEPAKIGIAHWWANWVVGATVDAKIMIRRIGTKSEQIETVLVTLRSSKKTTTPIKAITQLILKNKPNKQAAPFPPLKSKKIGYT